MELKQSEIRKPIANKFGILAGYILPEKQKPLAGSTMKTLNTIS